MYRENGKKNAANEALKFISDGMKIGIGTGSTTEYFIEALKALVETNQWTIQAAYSSEKSRQMASCPRIVSLDEGLGTTLDLYIDGADEVDMHFNMIKGGGKALLREKIVATASEKKMIVLVDESKLSKQLGRHCLPVEIISFGYKSTIQRILKEGFTGNLRCKADNNPDITDNGNYLFDITFDTPLKSPKSTHFALKEILGVVETGCFFELAYRVIIGYEDGRIKVCKHSLEPHFGG